MNYGSITRRSNLGPFLECSGCCARITQYCRLTELRRVRRINQLRPHQYRRSQLAACVEAPSSSADPDLVRRDPLTLIKDTEILNQSSSFSPYAGTMSNPTIPTNAVTQRWTNRPHLPSSRNSRVALVPRGSSFSPLALSPCAASSAMSAPSYDERQWGAPSRPYAESPKPAIADDSLESANPPLLGSLSNLGIHLPTGRQ